MTHLIVRKVGVDQLVWVGEEEVLVDLLDEGGRLLVHAARAPGAVQQPPAPLDEDRVPGVTDSLPGDKVGLVGGRRLILGTLGETLETLDAHVAEGAHLAEQLDVLLADALPFGQDLLNGHLPLQVGGVVAVGEKRGKKMEKKYGQWLQDRAFHNFRVSKCGDGRALFVVQKC